MTENPWIPDRIKEGLTTKQAAFLCYEGREALYGGAAGGVKSVALLAAALQFMQEPGYSAIILRRKFTQLSKSDSIMAKSKDWLWNIVRRGQSPKWNGSEKKWTFPNGNTLEFGHMEHDDSVQDYQGGIWPCICVDESSQFTEQMLSYPRTRQRKPPNSRLPMRWRGASNPGGIGHEYLKTRYIKDAQGNPIRLPDRAFFPATLEDNPHIDREDYVKSLRESGVDELTLEQLLKGNWDAVPGGRFKSNWFHNWTRRGDYVTLHKPDGSLPEFLLPRTMRFMTVDPAASTSQKADYTVISVWCVSPWGDLIWLDCLRVKHEIPDIVPEIQRMWSKWSPAWVGIEAIASNVAVYQMACRATSPVLIAKPLNKGDKDKLIHATPAIVLASTHRVYMPADGVDPRFPKSDILSELVRFTGDDKLDDHDDVVDTLSYACECLNGMPPDSARRAGPKVLGGGR